MYFNRKKEEWSKVKFILHDVSTTSSVTASLGLLLELFDILALMLELSDTLALLLELEDTLSLLLKLSDTLAFALVVWDAGKEHNLR